MHATDPFARGLVARNETLHLIVRTRHRARVVAACICIALAGCSGGGSTPPLSASGSVSIPAGSSTIAETVIDGIDTAGCRVSDDGLVWYSVSPGSFAPLDVAHTTCSSPSHLERDATPSVPSWANRTTGTQTIFIATSLQDILLTPGMIAMESAATAAGIPMTWLIQYDGWIAPDAGLYNQYHAANGDDVEVDSSQVLFTDAEANFPWFVPTVSAEGAGRERNIAGLPGFGESAFWGITWNSSGIDATEDRGAPWGTYCADPSSYKRPAPDGSCALVAFEWTARDLTRAYFSGLETAFSTDPDDIQLRGLFSPSAGAQYEAQLADAYASAGVTQPIVMMSQQESDEQVNGASGDPQVLAALYARAKSDGMRAMTLAQALPLARQFSAAPRAIAFPFLAGGAMTTSHLGEPFTPGTIDYHDAVAGMTFVAGHTTPSRVFPYALDTSSAFDVPLQMLAAAQTPTLQLVAAQPGSLVFHFDAPVATHYGVAIWSDPALLGVDPTKVTYAGHAGFVAAFDLPSGESDVTVTCGSCSAAQFTYST